MEIAWEILSEKYLIGGLIIWFLFLGYLIYLLLKSFSFKSLIVYSCYLIAVGLILLSITKWSILSEEGRKVELLIDPTQEKLEDSEKDIYFSGNKVIPISEWGNVSTVRFSRTWFPTEWWELLEGKKVEIDSSELIEGIIDFRAPDEAFINDSIWLSLRFNSTRDTEISLELPGAIADTISLPAGSHQINYPFKVPSRGIHYLHVYDPINRDTLIHLLRAREARIKSHLLLSSYPNPEITELSKYLGESGAKVQARIQLSREKYQFVEYNTTDGFNFRSISDRLLATIDVLIITSETLMDLSNSERIRIEKAVENGMGVYIISDGVRRSTKLMEGLKLSQNTRNARWEGYDFNLESSMVVGPDYRVIHQTEENDPLVVTRRLGWGRVVCSVVANSWKMVFNGYKEQFEAFHSKNFQDLGRRNEQRVYLDIIDKQLVKGELAHLDIKGKWSELVILDPNGVAINYQTDESLLEPGVFSIRFFPQKAGIYQVQYLAGREEKSERENFNLIVKNEPSSINRMDLSRYNINRLLGRTEEEIDKPNTYKEDVSQSIKYWLILLFLGMGWAIRKFA